LARIARQSPDDSAVQPAQSLTRDISAKWRDVLARIDSEEETLAACRASPDACSPAARRLLQLVELGHRREGRARLGEINRAVNLSIRPTSDWTQYGVDDFWSAPLATIEKGAGDCEDYAIVKYLRFAKQVSAPMTCASSSSATRDAGRSTPCFASIWTKNGCCSTT